MPRNTTVSPADVLDAQELARVQALQDELADQELSAEDVAAAASELPAVAPTEIDIARWARTHDGYLRGQLLAYGAKRHDLDDLVGELYLTAWRYAHTYRADRGVHPLTWLGNVIVRTVIYRHYAPQRELSRSGKKLLDKRSGWRKAQALEQNVTTVVAGNDYSDDHCQDLFGGHTSEMEVEGSVTVARFLSVLADRLTDLERALIRAGEGIEGALTLTRNQLAPLASELGLDLQDLVGEQRILRTKLQALAEQHFSCPITKKARARKPQQLAA